MDRSRLVIPLVVPLLWIVSPVAAHGQTAACPDGSACVWDQRDFQGSRAEVPDTGCIDSHIRSAVNGTDQVLVFFLGGGCVGARAGALQPGEESARISAGSATGDCSSGAVDQCDDGTPSPPPPPVGSAVGR